MIEPTVADALVGAGALDIQQLPVRVAMRLSLGHLASVLAVHLQVCLDGISIRRNATPNVRAKLPAEACSVSLVCEGAEGAAHQAYAACRSGSA